MDVWNMQDEQWEKYSKWMRWCPLYFFNTDQRTTVSRE
jgi:hypothetical protein